MATIELRNLSTGTWRAIICDGYKPDGTQNRIRRTIKVNPKSTEDSQRKQAQRQADLLQADYDRQQITNAKKLSFKTVYEDYLQDRVIRRGLAPQTVDSYKKLFDRELLPAFSNTAIREITARDINQFLRKLDNKGFSGTYSLKYFQQLRELFTYAKRTGIIAVNPCELVEPPSRDTQEAQSYEPDEGLLIKKSIKAYPETEWKAYFSLAFYTGSRPGELTGLNWSDYDGKSIFIQAGSYQSKGNKCERTNKPKTKKSIRKIMLTPEAVAALNAWKKEQAEYRLQFRDCWQDTDAVFTNDLGQRISSQTPAKRWKMFTEKYSIRPLPLYSLRHTHATYLIYSGMVSVEEVAARMGHEQTSTTINFYSHAFSNADERATAAFTNVLSRAAKEKKRRNA